MLKKRSGQLSDFVPKARDCDGNLYTKGLHVIKTQIHRRTLETMKKNKYINFCLYILVLKCRMKYQFVHRRYNTVANVHNCNPFCTKAMYDTGRCA